MSAYAIRGRGADENNWFRGFALLWGIRLVKSPAYLRIILNLVLENQLCKVVQTMLPDFPFMSALIYDTRMLDTMLPEQLVIANEVFPERIPIPHGAVDQLHVIGIAVQIPILRVLRIAEKTAGNEATEYAHIWVLWLTTSTMRPFDESRPCDWYGFTVGSILSKPEYMGHTVNFRTTKKSYKDKAVMNDPEDWVIFENTHEAIVDPETWQLAQKTRRTVHRVDTTGEANPFTGLVFCADCGAKMYNHRRLENPDDPSGKLKADSYNCSTFTLTIERAEKKCFSHSITTKALRALTLETIRTVSKYAIENEEEFIRKVREAAEIRQDEAAKDLKRRISKAKQRHAELETMIKALYESFLLGKIPEKRFEMLSASYEAEQAELDEIIAQDQANLDVFMSDSARIDQFMALARKYRDFDELTTPMINEFVEKILVHQVTRDEYGDRCQEVEIYLNFIGNFQVPSEEPTPEELAELEAQRKKRAANRRKYERKKERERQIQEGLLVPGEPYHLTCKCCGNTFDAKSPKAMFCSPKCRAKYYSQAAAESKKHECVCENCGTPFITTRSDKKYCCDACRVKARNRNQYEKSKALRTAGSDLTSVSSADSIPIEKTATA